MAARGEEPRVLRDLQREHGMHLGSRSQEVRGEQHEQSPIRNYVRDLVLGYNDGIVSVFAVTAGVTGAAFASEEIFVIGIAAAVAGALSMGAGEYISTKSQAEFYRAEREREREHLARWPHLEKQELRESFEAKGLGPALVDEVVETISKDPERFLDFMMREEFGIGEESHRSPLRAALVIMAAFLVGSALAVVPYGFLEQRSAIMASSALCLGGLFLAGVARAKASRLPSLSAGFEMVLIGAFAALVTYVLGRLIGLSV